MYKACIGVALKFNLVLIINRCVQWLRWSVEQGCCASRSHWSGASIRSPASSEQCSSDSDGGRQLWTRNQKLKVSFEGVSLNVAGSDRGPFAELFFELGFSRSAERTTVVLVLDQVDFGIKNCCGRSCSSTHRSCDGSCNPVFVHKITFQVRPKSWAHDCHRVMLEPYLTSKVFGLQRTSNCSLQVPVVSPKQASVTYQSGKTISCMAPAFEWNPASRGEDNSITWSWEFSRYADGSKFRLNKSRWGSMLQLGFQPGHLHMHPGSFHAEASWELPPNEEQQLGWDVNVTFQIAMFEQNRYFPRYSVKEVATISLDKVLTFL